MSRFSLDRKGPQVKVKMGPDLTSAVVPELRDLLLAIQEDGVQEVILDCAETNEVDASGLSLLLAARNSFPAERAFSMTAVQPSLLGMLRALRLERKLNAQVG